MGRSEVFEWVVVGAGPAGIAAIGKLLDYQIPREKIGWLDPDFQVGDLGQKWRSVPSNTKVGLFLKFLNDCDSFLYQERLSSFPIDHLSYDDTCLLKEVVAPLQWVTNHLLSTIHSIRGEALALNLNGGYWEIQTRSSLILSKNVILSTGAESKHLSYVHPSIIPLEVALNPTQLAQEIGSQDVVGVFGSSHSAVLALANLTTLDLQPKMVYNFYRSPHLYAVEMGNWILFDNTGLKGFAATWAKRNLDGTTPNNLTRCLVSDLVFEERMALCNKVIYAVGFERRKTPVLEQYPHHNYQETIGIIAPNLFGLGIAYPQVQWDEFGNREYQVGLWKFIDYLNKVMPIWLKYGKQL